MNVNITETKILSNDWYTLKKVTYNIQRNDGQIVSESREAYDRGNGAVILLYNSLKKTVILTRQFRLPTFINGNLSGMLIEACAGLLDNDNPEDCIRRETEEETGYQVKEIRKIFEAYMSPGSVTEILHFYLAEYSDKMKATTGGGLKEEEEYIEVLELDFTQVLNMMEGGEIMDAKTIMLLQYMKIHKIL